MSHGVASKLRAKLRVQYVRNVNAREIVLDAPLAAAWSQVFLNRRGVVFAVSMPNQNFVFAASTSK
jgi:hypothetical protein